MATTLTHPACPTSGEHDEAKGRRVDILRGALARQRTARDFHQQTTDAPAGHLGTVWRMTGENAVQDPVESVFLRRACTAGRTDHGDIAYMTENQQIARVNGQAYLIDHAAGKPDGRRYDIIGIGHGRGTEDDDERRTVLQCGFVLERGADGVRHGVGSMRDALFRCEPAPRGQKSGFEHASRLIHYGRFQGRQLGCDEMHPVATIGRHLEGDPLLQDDCSLRDTCTGHGKRDDLHGRDEIAGPYIPPIGETGERDRGINGVEAVDQRFVPAKETVC